MTEGKLDVYEKAWAFRLPSSCSLVVPGWLKASSGPWRSLRQSVGSPCSPGAEAPVVRWEESRLVTAVAETQPGLAQSPVNIRKMARQKGSLASHSVLPALLARAASV